MTDRRPHILIVILAGLLWANTPGPASGQAPPPEAEAAHPLPEVSPAPPPPPPPKAGAGEERGQRPPGKNPPRLSPERADAALDLLTELGEAEMAQRLRALQAQDPKAFNRELRRQAPRLMRLMRLKRYDRDMYGLQVRNIRQWRQMLDLTRALILAQEANDTDQIEALSGELDQQIATHLDLRRQIREREIQQMEQRLAALRQQLAEQNADSQNQADKLRDTLYQRATRNASPPSPPSSPSSPPPPRQDTPPQARNSD